jgi:acyl carrier protein
VLDPSRSPVHAAVARRADLVRELAEILVQTLRLRVAPDEIDPDAPLFGAGLQLDSIDSVELVVAIEETFRITLVDRQSGDPAVMRTLNTLADRLVEARGP